MSYSEKIDALDLVITVLKEHEKELDEAIKRLERALDIVEEPDGLELLRRYFK